MNENPYLNEESRGVASGMSGFMLGAIVGAGVALLFAPAAGTDTRRKLGETAKRLGSAARDKVQEGREQLQDRFGSSSDRERQGSSSSSPTTGFEAGRREPVPSTGSTTNPGQTGRTGATPGRSNP
ncbi:MAG TPA: YtxH domain-containing protein [Candidatus Binatia bacterium]|nr:YtxH domain-containing protein [Candidatus Binatia bacterium]